MLLKRFENYMLYEKNFSPHTINNYRKDISDLKAFSSKDLEKITDKDIKKFLKALKLKELANSSINRKLAGIKSFFKFLYSRGIIEHNPANEIEAGKAETKLPRPVSLRDVKTLYDTARGSREKLIVELLYSSGIRRVELVNIQIKDIDFENRTLKVMGKGKKERIVPLSSLSVELIKRQLKWQDSEWLFPSRRIVGRPITTRQLNTIVKKLTIKAGLEHKGITPHSFRHTFGTVLYENGADIKTIQDLLGHNSINTTNIYTKISHKRNMEEYQRAYVNINGSR